MIFDQVNKQYYVREKEDIALMISAYQPTRKGSDLLRVALDSMLSFKRKDACIWVIDVGSPPSKYLVTPEEYPTVNFVITDYTPRSWESTPPLKCIIKKLMGKKPPRAGSHANGWTLDFGIHSFCKLDYQPKYFMTLQMDVMFTRGNVLDALLELFDENTAAVGVRKQLNLDKTQEILHSLGCLWKTKKFKELKCGFMNEFPKYDVGEKLFVKARKAGMSVASLNNPFTDNSVKISKDKDYFPDFNIDKTLDKEGNIFFMHMGRGIAKSHKDQSNKLQIGDWQKTFQELILKR